MNYCSGCAQPVELQVPAGDERTRHVCVGCGLVHYQNPRVVVGSVPTTEDGRILLCRRAIEPRIGFWTLPAGFMELDETTAEGAAREAYEEARAQVEIGDLLALYDLAHVNQVQLFFSARLLSEEVEPGQESLEVALFTYDAIPWDELAFPSVHWVLHHQRDLGEGPTFPDRRSTAVGR
jgi:ADP-ribose pyrophosphatase YjhB (NUDIX family)